MVRHEVIAEHPELLVVFDKLTNLITDAEMAKMNYLVETEEMEPVDVAEQFLKNKGVLK